MEIRLLSDHRCDLVAERTLMQNRLRWHLLALCPDLEQSLKPRTLGKTRQLERVDRRLRRLVGSARVRIAREEVTHIRALTRQIDRLELELTALIKKHRPRLLAETGCGPLTAAILIGHTAGAERFRNDASFARQAGVAPILCSSGQRDRHRLHRGGDRQLNHALHVIAITRARCDPATKAYLARKQAEGKSKREATRCLKRHLARRFHHILATPNNPRQHNPRDLGSAPSPMPCLTQEQPFVQKQERLAGYDHRPLTRSVSGNEPIWFRRKGGACSPPTASAAAVAHVPRRSLSPCLWMIPADGMKSLDPSPHWQRHALRFLALALCIQCALAGVGCGGDASDRPSSRASTVPECDAAGINEHVGRQGTCVIGDVKRTVVDRRRQLVLDDDMEVRLRNLAVRPRGDDRIVVATLRVRNLRGRPFRWPVSARQVALWVNRRLISQDPSGRSIALRAIRPAAKPRVRLAAGRVASVAAGWRLSRSTAAGLRRRGAAIIMVPPGGGSEWVEGAVRIGVLRLWR